MYRFTRLVMAVTVAAALGAGALASQPARPAAALDFWSWDRHVDRQFGEATPPAQPAPVLRTNPR